MNPIKLIESNRIIEKINMSKNSYTPYDLAVQQFEGYTHGRQGYSIASLADGMGLTEKEWNKLKKEEKYLFRKEDIRDINKYFQNK